MFNGTDDIADNMWLGAVAGYTIGHAGYKRSSSHGTFCGVTSAIAPNHSLCVSGESVVEKAVLFEKSTARQFCKKVDTNERVII